MCADRGFICLIEVDIGFPLHPGMVAVVKSRLTPVVFRDMILTGARIGGADATARGIVDEAVPLADVLPNAITRAAALAAKDRQTYAALKRGMYAELLKEPAGSGS
jgi:enoyl-CoA hydratase/carnithine racemase